MKARPFYAVAHHCNVVADVRAALEAGANGIECDIQWDEGLRVRHPAVLTEPFPNGTGLDDFLPAVREAARAFGERFALMICDIKATIERDHASELLSRIRAELLDTELNVLLTVPKIERAGIFDGIAAGIGAREGLGVDEEDDPDAVAQYFARARVVHAGYGNGIDSGIPHFGGDTLEDSVRRAVAIRDTSRAFALVYRWTLNTRASMCRYLDLGADSIVTDHVGDLLELLRESPYRERLRLARRSENPFVPGP